jgi:phage gpG-like protein
MASVSFKITRNDISPKLAKLAATAKRPEPVLRAMGTTFMSITMGNFNDAGAEYRPKPWANKTDGTASKLQASITLARSFHLTVTNVSATVSNPTIYAAIHQFGGKTSPHEIRPKNKKALAFGGGVYAKVNHPGSNIPARPFFPVDAGGKLTLAAEEKIAAAGQRAILRQLQ